MFDWIRRLGLVLFSAWYWSFSFLWMLVGVLISIVLLTLRFPYQKVHVWVTARFFSACVPLSLTRLRVHHHPDYDPEQRGIYTQNHINLIDGQTAAAVIPHAFSGLMNAWQFKIPIYGWMMTVSKGIPVRRGRRDETIREISEAARDRVASGMSVLTFPEGHRTLDGKIRKFRRGVFLMARNSGAPVIPITVRGMYEVNRKGSLVFHPFRTVDVFIGPQFSAAGLSDDELEVFADRLRDFMVHCLDHGAFPEDFDIGTAGTNDTSANESPADSARASA